MIWDLNISSFVAEKESYEKKENVKKIMIVRQVMTVFDSEHVQWKSSVVAVVVFKCIHNNKSSKFNIETKL